METLVLTGRQAEKVLRDAAENILREVTPKFRVAERDRPEKNWLTNAEAQNYLGLSRATLARYRATGKLLYAKVGSSIYYRIKDIEAFIEAGQIQSRRVGRSTSIPKC